jgi:hypothetical protein
VTKTILAPPAADPPICQCVARYGATRNGELPMQGNEAEHGGNDDDGVDAQPGCAAGAEQEIAAHGGQQKYAVIEMMDVLFNEAVSGDARGASVPR